MTNAVSIAQSGSNNVTFRNKIINGAMMIDQRNAGTTTTANGFGGPDRYNSYVSAGVMTKQQVSDGPSGFSKSLKCSTTTASAGSIWIVQQLIEGQNVVDLAFGSASASAVTVSFWVKSSVTGTFSGVLGNGVNTRSYVFTYTINAANTWEQKTATVAGDTSGTWATDNTAGFKVMFSIGTSSAGATTAGSWQTGDYIRTSASVGIDGTLNATWQVTGVQLEAGTTATPFEQRLYGTELALCYRYFQSFKPSSAYTKYGLGIGNSATTIYAITITPKATMRAAPSLTATNCYGNDGNSNLGPVSALNNLSSPDGITFDCTIPSGGIAGRPVTFGDAGSINAVFTASAEL